MNLNNFYLFLGLLLILFSCSDAKENIPSENIETLIKEEEKSKSNVENDSIFNKEILSDVFKINNLNCYWRSDSVFKVVEKETIPLCEINRVLINSDNKETILKLNPDDGLIYEDNLRGTFKDMNLDGFNDFVKYSEENSGSGGSYYNVYLFNFKKQLFELSELHSGSGLEIDSSKRTLSSYWRSGADIRLDQIIYFDKKGNVNYYEKRLKESVFDDQEKRVITYEKFVDDKLIIKKIDTTINLYD